MEDEDTMKQLRRTLLWTAALVLCAAWQAGAQPRPPISIPMAAIPIRPPLSLMPPAPPVALIPPAVPLPVPLPPARPAPTPVTMPLHVPLPPPEFDHEYKGRLTIAKLDNYRLIRAVCEDNPDAIACSFRIYDSTTGAPISCLIMLGPMTHDDERVLRHELGHCNGWTNEHEGAR
jgi:hypothetical protein